MITEAETGNILYTDCLQFGVKVYQTLNTPLGKAKSERIVIIPKTQQKGDYWIKNYVEVNWVVPDIMDSAADMVRLHSIERMLLSTLVKYGSFDNTPYRYKVECTDIKADKPLGAHYVNARVLFYTMNIN